MKCGLLGEKLGHSFSPQIHSMLTDIYDYSLFEVSRDDLKTFMTKRDFDGINVTIPYKKEVMRFLDGISEKAAAIGCVNTIKNTDGYLYGDNTDYDGFSYILDRLDLDLQGKKVLVLGSGGGSLTVRTVLAERKAGQVVVISRNGPDNYENINKHCDASLIVNATPVGMYPDNLHSLVDLDVFRDLEAVADIVYNPILTRILLDAKERGIKYVNGLGMLVSQARRASEIFTGETISDDVVETITERLEKERLNVILIGMPGCGKTSVGKAVSEKLGRKHFDIDGLITERIGMPIHEFFAQNGEGVFRRVETEIMSDICRNTGVVISTGGGAVTRNENYDILKQNGVIVLLDRPLDQLEVDGRPLSLSRSVEVLYNERKDMYNMFSDFSVKCTTIDSTAEEVIERFLSYRGE
ncbi:MAG: AAA family ATPase [Clostridia bacterium]|nr:AAA family ATPase [Clostridia bacterium]